eukprot:9201969-Pyramimonas_sp.AAC.1
MIKSSSTELKEALLYLCNSTLKPNGAPPDEWRHTVIKVMPKSGDPQQAKNYIPICTIPLLYKLFSRLLYNRLQPVLDKRQTDDQAGFRPGRSVKSALPCPSAARATVCA